MSSTNNQDFLPRSQKWLQISGWLLPFLYVLIVAALYGAFLYAPRERVMGEVQRIFYFHLGSAWNCFLAFFAVALAGVLYLVTRNEFWDHVAAASAEIGIVFATIVLATGSIWARPIWNTWWPWGDPRVTTMLVLWLIYVAYLILRSSLPDGEKKFKLCAVFGIIGFLDVPIVWMSIRWWRTIHPVVIASSGGGLAPKMVHALMIAVPAFTVLYLTALLLRTAMHLHQGVARELNQAVLERGRP